MKTASRYFPFLFGGAAGVAATVFFTGPRADAQAPAPAGTPRYQATAYAGVTGGSVSHGCYIIDTVTGDIWQAQLGQQPQKVTGKLR